MAKHSRPRLRWLLIVSPLLLLGALETTNIIASQIAISNWVREGLRYAVTGLYDSSLCGTPPVLERAAQTLREDGITLIARTVFTHDVSVEVNANLLRDLDLAYGKFDCQVKAEISTYFQEKFDDALGEAARYYSIRKIIQDVTPPILDSRYLNITICSDSPGYSYDSTRGQCLPREDAGRSGDHVTIKVIYSYPFGSSLGITSGYLYLHASNTWMVEKYR